MTTIESWPISRPLPYARNARKIPEKAVDKVASSIAEFGWQQPIVVDKNGVIIVGHTRLLAAKKLGLEAVPVHVAGNLTEGQVKAYRLMDNRSHEEATWDLDLVQAELCDLREFAVDLALTGFDACQISEFLGTETKPEPQSLDEEVGLSVQAEIVSRPGDLWRIGEHILLCGDSRDPVAVSTLLGGDRAALCFTSPPYGQQREYRGGISDWDELMRGVFANLPMADDGQVLVNLGLIHRESEVVPYWDTWIEWMRSQGWRRFGWYVWDQGPGMPGDWAGRLAPSFEFVFHFNRTIRRPNKIVPCKMAGIDTHSRLDGTSTAMRRKNGEVAEWTQVGTVTQDFRVPDNVIRVMRHKGRIGEGIDHPAVFPVALPEQMMLAYTNAGDIVFEPFGGSGTTILAAQRQGRRARVLELAPEYADVVIRRFQQNYSGVPISLAATGQTFDEVSYERSENNHAVVAS
ncbi:MAG: ParB N-terminal domain-containing protein [Bryobacterales bacterium]|nr:ParB N-terminal domain-containing protein [Bryobacterales bacterium]